MRGKLQCGHVTMNYEAVDPSYFGIQLLIPVPDSVMRADIVADGRLLILQDLK